MAEKIAKQILVKTGVRRLLAERYKVSEQFVGQALRGEKICGKARLIRGTAKKEYHGVETD